MDHMDLHDAWETIGRTTYRTEGHLGGDCGEGDSTGGPNPARSRPDAWPTLVIEPGHTASLRLLEADMKWWFSASNHEVKIAIVAKFDQRRHEIIVQTWEEGPPSLRPGAMTTPGASSVSLQLEKRQEIRITRDDTNPALFHAANGPLILPFRLLFLRHPGPGEHDIVFDVPYLQMYAASVWRSA